MDRLFRSDTNIPAPAVEDIPSEVEISRWEAASHRGLFSQRTEGATAEASVPPPPPPPVGRENLRESLDSLPPILAFPTSPSAATPAQESTPPETTDELDVSLPGELRNELDTSRPPPMSTATRSVPAVVIAAGPLPAPVEGSVLEDDERAFALEGEASPPAQETSSAPVAVANEATASSARARLAVFGAVGLALLAAGGWAATMLFVPQAPTIAREPAPPPATPVAKPPAPVSTPPVAKTEPVAPKVEPPIAQAPAPEPTPNPPVAKTEPVAPKLEPPPDVVKPEPPASAALIARAAPEPAAKPSQASSPAASITPPPVPKRSVAPVEKPVAKPRPTREAAAPRVAPEPVASTAAKLSASETTQTIADARRKLAADDAEGAEELMRQLLQHEPRNDQALDVLARALIDQDRGAAAAAVAEKLVALRSRTVAYWLLLGDALLMKGDDAGAKKAWHKALELRPGDAGATQRLGL